MLKNGQTYFKNFAVFTPQDFKSMFGHFSTLCNKGLNRQNTKIQLSQKHHWENFKITDHKYEF